GQRRQAGGPPPRGRPARPDRVQAGPRRARPDRVQAGPGRARPGRGPRRGGGGAGRGGPGRSGPGGRPGTPRPSRPARGARARALPPPRWAYVEAVAATLARTRQPREAVEPVRRRARELIARRAGLPADADRAELHRAALRLGLAEDEATAALGGGTTDGAAVLAAGRALARLAGGER